MRENSVKILEKIVSNTYWILTKHLYTDIQLLAGIKKLDRSYLKFL